MGDRAVTTQQDASKFVWRAIGRLTPHVEASFGRLPKFGIADYPPAYPPGHPEYGRSVGAGLRAGYDIRTRRPVIFYDPEPLMRAIRGRQFFYINMFAHELIHVYQAAAKITHYKLTHEQLVAETQRPYTPDPLKYWAEGSAVLGELQVMIGILRSDGKWRSIVRELFGRHSDGDGEEPLFGEYGLETRVYRRLASMIVLASREHNRSRPDMSLVRLPFALPRDLIVALRQMKPYHHPFLPRELPYYLGGYYCCRWMVNQRVGLGTLIRTPLTEIALRQG